MGFNLGLAAIAGNAANDQSIALRKDAMTQEMELDARSKREEFASHRGLRDNAAAFEGEKVDQGRADQRRDVAIKQATQAAISKAAADFEAQNPYQSQMEAPAMNALQGSTAPIGLTAPQAASGIAPSAAPGQQAPASMASAGMAGTAPTPAQGVAPVAKQGNPSRSMERAAFIAQAVADQHLTSGNMAGYQEASTAAMRMRDALRADRFSRADGKYAQDGDASIYVKEVYPLIHDGFTLVSAKQESGNIITTRRNDQTGAEETKSMPVDKFLAGVRELRTPGIIAATEERIAGEKRAVANKIAEGEPDLASKERIASMKDATDRITANASAANSYAAAGYNNAQAVAIATPPVWSDKADAYLESKYTVKDETTGATSVDGNGLQFAKQLAVAQSRRNGGDTTSALGYAFEADNQLKARVDAAMKADPKADPKALLRAERANLLRALNTPKQDAAPQDGQGATFRGAQAEYDAGKAHRTAEQRRILKQEIAAQKNPQNIAALQRELARLGPEPSQRNAADSGLPVKAVAAKTKQADPGKTTLAQRMTQAIMSDNQSGSSRNFDALADESEKSAPEARNQIAALRAALSKTKAASEKSSLENRIALLEADLPMMESIIAQRKAKRGY